MISNEPRREPCGTPAQIQVNILHNTPDNSFLYPSNSTLPTRTELQKLIATYLQLWKEAMGFLVDGGVRSLWGCSRSRSHFGHFSRATQFGGRFTKVSRANGRGGRNVVEIIRFQCPLWNKTRIWLLRSSVDTVVLILKVEFTSFSCARIKIINFICPVDDKTRSAKSVVPRSVC